MRRIARFYSSAVGKKAVMAVTGLVLFGFVFVHMAGNLKLYLGTYAEGAHAGAYQIDVYGEFLREVGMPLVPREGLLWLFRLGLLAAVGVHIHAATTLTLLNRRARPEAYSVRHSVQAGYAERTMRWGGVLIGLFILYHLAHFTFGWEWAHPDFRHGEVHHNLVAGFRVWYVSAFYMVAQVALGFHLFHGLWSLFQSLGWSVPTDRDWRRTFATVFAWVIALANISFPLAVLSGLVR